MARVFSFALGTIWRWTKSNNRNVLLNYARELDISGVEITFVSSQELYAFRISEKNRSWLRKLEYVSIHAPLNLVSKSKDECDLIKQMDIISQVYKDINASSVIIHPNEMPAPKFIRKYRFNISTENLTPDRNITIQNLRNLFRKYKNMKLCLDVSHAYMYSRYETSRLVEAFRDKISQVHFSGTYRGIPHQSLRKVTKTFLSSIQIVKELDVPIVIEENIGTKNLNYVREEIRYIKELFKLH